MAAPLPEMIPTRLERLPARIGDGVKAEKPGLGGLDRSMSGEGVPARSCRSVAAMT